MIEGLPIPPHVDPSAAEGVWRVDYAARARDAAAWAGEHGIRPASEDERRVCLLAVDCQNTFCLPEFELFVAGPSGCGAVDDTARLCRFVYRNLGALTEIVATLDTHGAIQIFHPVFWVDEDGAHPEGGGTQITVEDVESGRWRVNPAVAPAVAGGDLAWLERYVLHYVRRLAEGRYPLMVWPYHAMLGGTSHALVSAAAEAFFVHAVARRQPTRFEIKGNNPLTEHYSALSPEVLEDHEGRPVATKNTALIEHLLDADALIIAGQAKSHCVAWTVHDLLGEIRARDPSLAGKVYLLEDCTSPVVVPGADFTAQAEDAFREFAEAGMHIVRSSEPVPAWDGIRV